MSDQAFIQHCKTLQPALQGLQTLRNQALTNFLKRGLPHRKEEDWRYTDLTCLNKYAFQLPERSARAPSITSLTDCYSITLIDGCFSPEHSQLHDLDDHFKLTPVSEMMRQNQAWLEPYLSKAIDNDRYPFVSLNHAFFQDGYYLWVPEKTILKKPIHILHYWTKKEHPRMTHPVFLVRLADDSEMTLIEEFQGEAGPQWMNSVHQVHLNSNARLTYYKLQAQSHEAFHTDTTFVEQSRNSCLTTANFSLGSALSRDDWRIKLNEKGAECHMLGLYLPRDRQLIDHHLQIEHNAKHTQSNVFYKGIASEKGRAVYNGQVHVPPHSQKVHAHQFNPNLLLSNAAEINTKPELLIYADDVKCTHGSTVGHLDQQALYYLRCRGLDYETAMGVLLYAFAKDPLNYIRHKPFYNRVHQRLKNSLPFTPPIEVEDHDNS